MIAPTPTPTLQSPGHGIEPRFILSLSGYIAAASNGVRSRGTIPNPRVSAVFPAVTPVSDVRSRFSSFLHSRQSTENPSRLFTSKQMVRDLNPLWTPTLPRRHHDALFRLPAWRPIRLIVSPIRQASVLYL